jgi:hypothetical protein
MASGRVGVWASTPCEPTYLSWCGLRSLASRKEDAVAEAKQSIDRILSRLDNWLP